MIPQTYVYKQVDGIDMSFDLYLPTLPSKPMDESVHIQQSSLYNFPHDIPAVVYFHGGGMTVGTRKSWFPVWLHQRLISVGVAHISADYRLMPPSNGHDIVSDIVSLLEFLRTSLNPRLQDENSLFRIDPTRIAVAGSSAGGLCAYLAAAHAVPKPAAVLSLYGLGGSFMTSHYLTPKLTPFFRNRELLDVHAGMFTPFIYPDSASLDPSAGSELAYHPPDTETPGYPANPRMLLGRLYLQQGTFLDYWTGAHEPSLSATLRSAIEDADALAASVPPELRPVFPEFLVAEDWPPTYLVHGELDSAVPVADSRNMFRLLDAAGVNVELRIVQGAEHSFDYQEGADQAGKFGMVFDEAVRFLIRVMTVDVRN